MKLPVKRIRLWLVAMAVVVGVTLVVRGLPGPNEEAPSVPELLELSQAYIRWGEQHADLNAPAVAESIAYLALETDSLNVDVLNQLARAKFALERYDEVLRIEHYTLRLYPRDPVAWGIQGDAYQATGKYRNADSSYYFMLNVDQGFHSMARVAREEFLLRDYDLASQYIDEAIEKAETEEVAAHDLAAVYVQLVEMLLSRGYIEPALNRIDYALALQAESSAALALKARLLHIQRRYREAETICRRLFEISDHPRYKSLLVRLYKELGRDSAADSLVQVASTQFETLARDFPERVRRDQAKFYLEWDIELERALALAHQESRERRDAGAYSLLAWAYHKNGRHDLAWSSISLALRRGVQHPEFFYRAAIIARAAGKMDRYRTFAARVRDLTPNVERVYGSL